MRGGQVPGAARQVRQRALPDRHVGLPRRRRVPVPYTRSRPGLLQQTATLHRGAPASLRGRLRRGIWLLHAEVRLHLREQPLGQVWRPRVGAREGHVQGSAIRAPHRPSGGEETKVRLHRFLFRDRGPERVPELRAVADAEGPTGIARIAAGAGLRTGSEQAVRKLAEKHHLARRPVQPHQQEVAVERRHAHGRGELGGRAAERRWNQPDDRALALHDAQRGHARF
mmetsp:Transcript_111302/g.278682  ORF Transcript_111302/g.278682 Transcript_111302/m.278682 type:complete len:226 (-) Transcript_111302:1270-1947(-)